MKDKVNQSMSNDFGIENYDEYRFGKYVPEIDSQTFPEKRKVIQNM